MTKQGILIQGLVSKWTGDIIHEYQKNFPDAKIVFSTWLDQNVKDLSCEIIQTELPSTTAPHPSTINHQIIGAREGLKKLNCDVTLKSKSDLFIHNDKIFELFHESCAPDKIMIPTEGFDLSNEPYYVSDICQVGKTLILKDFWNQMPLYDGSYPTSNEQYLARNYILNIKKDTSDWSITQKKYFCQKGFDEDFQAEFEKFIFEDSYQKSRKNLRDSNKELTYEQYIELID